MNNSIRNESVKSLPRKKSSQRPTSGFCLTLYTGPSFFKTRCPVLVRSPGRLIHLIYIHVSLNYINKCKGTYVTGRKFGWTKGRSVCLCREIKTKRNCDCDAGLDLSPESFKKGTYSHLPWLVYMRACLSY